jgi:hypothetical protein
MDPGGFPVSVGEIGLREELSRRRREGGGQSQEDDWTVS